MRAYEYVEAYPGGISESDSRERGLTAITQRDHRSGDTHAHSPGGGSEDRMTDRRNQRDRLSKEKSVFGRQPQVLP